MIVFYFIPLLVGAFAFECPEPNGITSDPADCSKFYVCANDIPYHEDCAAELYFEETYKICDRKERVECGDRPEPGTTTPHSTTSTVPTPSTSTEPTTPTTTQPTTSTASTESTSPGPTTSTTPGTTTTRDPNPPKMPKYVMSLYILLADDTEEGYDSNATWVPKLYPWQQTGSNVLFFTFVHPGYMEIPLSFRKLAATRGTGAEGAVPKDTIIMFAIGGYAYSRNPNPWPWLTSQSAAEAMAVKVATWPGKYGCDGIDLDIEAGAGSSHEAGINMNHFIKKLKSLQPDIVIGQPVYGFPQVAAESDVVNESWNKDGTSNNLAYSVGLMVYSGTEALRYVKNYAKGSEQWSGFPIHVNVPYPRILLGCMGSAGSGTIMALANSAVSDDLMGIMVWYASVIGGLRYQESWDASFSDSSISGYGQAKTLFDKYNQ